MTWLAQGRAAFAILPFARHAQLNRPDQSRFPGKLQRRVPGLHHRAGGTRMATTVEFWSMSIPRMRATSGSAGPSSRRCPPRPSRSVPRATATGRCASRPMPMPAFAADNPSPRSRPRLCRAPASLPRLPRGEPRRGDLRRGSAVRRTRPEDAGPGGGRHRDAGAAAAAGVTPISGSHGQPALVTGGAARPGARHRGRPGGAGARVAISMKARSTPPRRRHAQAIGAVAALPGDLSQPGAPAALVATAVAALGGCASWSATRRPRGGSR